MTPERIFYVSIRSFATPRASPAPETAHHRSRYHTQRHEPHETPWVVRAPQPLALSLYANSRGLGYVLFEKPLTLFDWGVKKKKGRGKDVNRVLMRGVEKLLVLYRPAVVILEDWRDRDRPRCARVEALYESIVSLCERMSVPVEAVPISAVHRAFAPYGATTKEEIAQLVAKRIPALSLQPPPKRKFYDPEPLRQAIYDAAALGLTFFQRSMRHGQS